MNPNHINFFSIKNFKSIKNQSIDDCKRINLFIGKPNVGKSNILESLSLFGVFYLKYSKKRSLQQFVRAETDSELFFDGDVTKMIDIISDIGFYNITSNEREIILALTDLFDDGGTSFFPFSELNYLEKSLDSTTTNPFKSYFYPTTLEKEKNSLAFLLPPNGNNLMSIVSKLPNLKEELKLIFEEYGLQYAFDTNSQEIKVIKKKNDDEIFLIPFNSIADSLKRMIFYKAAIESNKNSILIFEEPEAHSYPPYISKITQSIIASETNQFFITTHSPYVVNDFLENNSNELAIYLVDFKNGETVVKRLSEQELQQVYEYGIDLFYNTETFLE